MKQILVATDFSNCARNAMEYALELAKAMQLEVCAIHAIGSTEGINNNIYNALYIEDYYNIKREALKTWTGTFTANSANKDVPVSTVCEVGSVSTVLAKYIEKNDVALLVMGSMGSTGITDIFGSNSSTMISKTKTPTLVLPLESKFASQPVITMATDFTSKLSTEEVDILNDMIASTRAEKLNVINIIEGKGAWKINEEGEAALRSLINATALDFNYINEDNATDGIINFVASNQTDILVLVNRTHNLLYRIFNKSTVNQVMARSIKAVLVLHE